MQTNYNGYSKSSGVYQIRNLNNGRVYIGSAKCFQVRYSQHVKSLEKGTHHNKHLQSAFNKQGAEAFVFEILEVVEGEQEARLLVEQKHLDLLMDDWERCYNFMKKSNIEGRSFFSKNPEVTREKLSKAQKALWQDPVERVKRIEGADGMRRERIGQASKQVYKDMTQEQRQEMSLNRKKIAKEAWSSQEHRDRTIESMKRAGKLSSVKLQEKCKTDPAYKEKLMANLQKANNVQKTYKTYHFVNPNGIVVEITGLKVFCEANNLLYQSMCSMVCKKQFSHRGWTLLV